MKTMWASPRSSVICSRDSSAARRPASGFAPQPRPEVSSVPIWRRFSVRVVARCWASVFRARKSTPVIECMV